MTCANCPDKDQCEEAGECLIAMGVFSSESEQRIPIYDKNGEIAGYEEHGPTEKEQPTPTNPSIAGSTTREEP